MTLRFASLLVTFFKGIFYPFLVRQREQFVLAFNDVNVVAESEYVSCCSFALIILYVSLECSSL